MTELWLPKFVFVQTTKKILWSFDTLGEALAEWPNYSFCTLEKEYPNGLRAFPADVEMSIPWTHTP